MGCCKSRRRWLEPHIDYDPDFREHQKVHGTTYHCPSGHLMEELVTHKAGYLACDVCGRPQNVGKRMQGCWACDYHVCASCETKFQDPEWYASWRKFWSPETPENPENLQEEVVPVRPRCPGKHSLCQYFTGEEPPVQCDVCGKRLAPYIRIWGCSSCDYDIGPCCEQKFQDPQFLHEWQAFWKLPKTEVTEATEQIDVVVDPPLPAPSDPPSIASAEGPSPVTPVVPAAEGPKVPITRPKPVQLNTTEELKRTQEDSAKAMVLGGQNHVVAHGLMKAVLKKDEPSGSSRASSRIPDPAVLKFAAKLKSPAKELSSLSETSSKVSGDAGEEGEKKSKKKNKEDKEKSEKSEKKEKKLKKEGKEGKEAKEGRSNEGEETGQTDRRSRKVKKSRRETESPE